MPHEHEIANGFADVIAIVSALFLGLTFNNTLFAYAAAACIILAIFLHMVSLTLLNNHNKNIQQFGRPDPSLHTINHIVHIDGDFPHPGELATMKVFGPEFGFQFQIDCRINCGSGGDWFGIIKFKYDLSTHQVIAELVGQVDKQQKSKHWSVMKFVDMETLFVNYYAKLDPIQNMAPAGHSWPCTVETANALVYKTGSGKEHTLIPRLPDAQAKSISIDKVGDSYILSYIVNDRKTYIKLPIAYYDTMDSIRTYLVTRRIR